MAEGTRVMDTKLREDFKRPTPEEVARALREGQEAVKRELAEVKRQSLRRDQGEDSVHLRTQPSQPPGAKRRGGVGRSG